MKFRKWFEANSSKSIRARIKLADLSQTNYKTKTNARKDLNAAMMNAQQINKENGGNVRVYHMISPSRTKSNIEQILAFLNSKSRTEISVSVNKGVWNSGLVITGQAKLLAYWKTDIYSVKIPNSPYKIPKEHDRSNNSHHWDEALIRLSDVEWDYLYVGEDENVLYGFGGYNAIKEAAKKYDIRLDHSSYADYHSPLRIQYEDEQTIEELKNHCMELSDSIREISWKLKNNNYDDQHREFLNEILHQFRDYMPSDFFQKSPSEIIEELTKEIKELKIILKKLKDMQ